MALQNYDLIEAKRSLLHAKRRSSSGQERSGTQSPKLGLKGFKLGADVHEGGNRRWSTASSVASSSGDKLKWLVVDGVWKRVKLEEKDDFEDENPDVAINVGIESWMSSTVAEQTDVPEIVIEGGDTISEHLEQASKCGVSNILKDDTVILRLPHE